MSPRAWLERAAVEKAPVPPFVHKPLDKWNPPTPSIVAGQKMVPWACAEKPTRPKKAEIHSDFTIRERPQTKTPNISVPKRFWSQKQMNYLPMLNQRQSQVCDISAAAALN